MGLGCGGCGMGCGCAGLGDDPLNVDPYTGQDFTTGLDTSNLPTVPPATAGGSNIFGNIAANLANDWTKIFGQIVAPQTTYVRNPATGQLVLTTPANQTANAALLTSGGFLPSSGGMSSMLPLLLIAGVGVLLISKS